MAVYSQERKESILRKVMSSENKSYVSIAREEGIHDKTLYNWRREAGFEGVNMSCNRNRTSNKWDGEAKLAVILQTAGLNEAELGEYCRSKGIYKEQVTQWRQDCIDSFNSGKNKAATQKSNQQEVKQLKKELRRKDKALAESAALLVLQKKFQELWEDEEQ